MPNTTVRLKRHSVVSPEACESNAIQSKVLLRLLLKIETSRCLFAVSDLFFCLQARPCELLYCVQSAAGQQKTISAKAKTFFAYGAELFWYWQAGLKPRSHRFWSVLVGALDSLWREGELVAVEFNLGATLLSR